MKYRPVADIAERWKVSKRTVRNYYAQRCTPDAFLTGKT